jgi:hypothetical protein
MRRLMGHIAHLCICEWTRGRLAGALALWGDAAGVGDAGGVDARKQRVQRCSDGGEVCSDGGC